MEIAEITKVNGKNVVIHQGNFINPLSVVSNALFAKAGRLLNYNVSVNNPTSKFYIGQNIQTGSYNFNKGTYSRQTSAGSAGYGTISITLPSIQNITGLNIEPRRWNFMSWNN